MQNKKLLKMDEKFKYSSFKILTFSLKISKLNNCSEKK